MFVGLGPALLKKTNQKNPETLGNMGSSFWITKTDVLHWLAVLCQASGKQMLNDAFVRHPFSVFFPGCNWKAIILINVPEIGAVWGIQRLKEAATAYFKSECLSTK